MRWLFRHSNLSISIMLLSLLIVFGNAAPLRAFNFFGSEQSKEQAKEPAKEPAQAPQPLTRTDRLPSFAAIAKASMPAVVNIATTQKVQWRHRRSPFPSPEPFGGEDPFEEFFRRFFGNQPPPSQQRSLGSGFIISKDGYIVTNNHVVGDADQITVRLSDNEEYKAKVIGADEKTDVALIKIDASHSLPTLPLGNSADLQVGDWVLAIGNPFGLQETVTAGIVSALGRTIGAGPYDDFIQTDASINPGNSGGPLLNEKGEVVGMNTAIFSQSGGNIGIGFAIPIDLAKTIVSQLKKEGKVTRAWLGVTIQEVTREISKSFGLKEPTGALIADVVKNGPADKAGLKRGDIITAFAGSEIKDSHDLPVLVAQTPVGERVDITVLRDGKKRTFTAKLEELTEQRAAAEGTESEEQWGMTVANLSPDVVRRFQLDRDQEGVAITDVEDGSPASLAGIQPGDVIEEVNRQPVKSVDDFRKALSEAKERNTLLLLVRRGNATMFFALRNGE